MAGLKKKINSILKEYKEYNKDVQDYAINNNVEAVNSMKIILPSEFNYLDIWVCKIQIKGIYIRIFEIVIDNTNYEQSEYNSECPLMIIRKYEHDMINSPCGNGGGYDFNKVYKKYSLEEIIDNTNGYFFDIIDDVLDTIDMNEMFKIMTTTFKNMQRFCEEKLDFLKQWEEELHDTYDQNIKDMAVISSYFKEEKEEKEERIW